MSLFNPDKYKLKPPVKKEFEGEDVYILPALNGLQSLAFSQEVTGFKDTGDELSELYPAAVVKARVVDSEGVAVFPDVAVTELINMYDSKMFKGLYAVVKDVVGTPSTVEESEKKS